MIHYLPQATCVCTALSACMHGIACHGERWQRGVPGEDVDEMGVWGCEDATELELGDPSAMHLGQRWQLTRQ
jgi:hypothetical protein